MSIRSALLLSLSTTMMSGRLCSITWSVWILMSVLEWEVNRGPPALYLNALTKLIALPNELLSIIIGSCTPLRSKRPLLSVRVSVGSRAPLSSKRPLLSLCVSVCLFVCLFVCPVSSPVHPLPVDQFGWNLAVRTHLGSNSLLWSFSQWRPLAGELWTKNLIFRGVTPNASSATVLNLFFWNFGTMES